jgi:hypothetical protein
MSRQTHWVDSQAVRVPTVSNLMVGLVTDEVAAAADEATVADLETAADEVAIVDLEAATDATTSEMGVRPVVVD